MATAWGCGKPASSPDLLLMRFGGRSTRDCGLGRPPVAIHWLLVARTLPPERPLQAIAAWRPPCGLPALMYPASVPGERWRLTEGRPAQQTGLAQLGGSSGSCSINPMSPCASAHLAPLRPHPRLTGAVARRRTVGGAVPCRAHLAPSCYVQAGAPSGAAAPSSLPNAASV